MNMFCAGINGIILLLIGHSFGGLVSKSLVVKLKRKSTIRNRINSKLACTCSLLFIQCLLQNQGKDRRIKENTWAQIEKNRGKKWLKKKQRKEEVKLGNMAKKKHPVRRGKGEYKKG
jgi:hypothetical protein